MKLLLSSGWFRAVYFDHEGEHGGRLQIGFGLGLGLGLGLGFGLSAVAAFSSTGGSEPLNLSNACH